MGVCGEKPGQADRNSGGGDGSFGGRCDAAALERIWQNLKQLGTFEYVMTKKGGGWLAADVRYDESRNREIVVSVPGNRRWSWSMMIFLKMCCCLQPLLACYKAAGGPHQGRPDVSYIITRLRNY